MVERKSNRNSEFQITVQYHRRNHCYRVKHQLVNDGKEVFNIIAKHKTIVLTSKRPQLYNQVLMDIKQVYSYNKHEVTNKCLMNRIIEAIDKYLQFNN
jgi:hypothetical protein